MSRRPQERWFAGKVVARVEWNKFDDGRGGDTCDPVIVFEDGSRLVFCVAETEVGEYGIEPIYRARRRSR